jgi:hypothetical protein
MKCARCPAEGRNVEVVVVGAVGTKEPLCPSCVRVLVESSAQRKTTKAVFGDEEETE